MLNLEKELCELAKVREQGKYLLDERLDILPDKFVSALKKITIPPVPKVATPRLDLRSSLKTIRKLPRFGYTDKERLPIDFEWPTVKDLRGMKLAKAVKAVAINWHGSDFTSSYIGAIQIVLSNGKFSPVFRASQQCVKEC